MENDELKDFLSSLNNSDVRPLVEIIRAKAELTNDLDASIYLNDPSNFANDIVDELSLFGANTFVSIFRGGGVEYEEIVRNVAKRIKAKYSAYDSIEQIENAIIVKLFNSCYEKLNYEQRSEIKNMINYEVDGQEYISDYGLNAGLIFGGAPVALLSSIVLYNSIAIVANSIYQSIIGKGLTNFSIKMINEAGVGFLKGSIKGLKLGGNPFLKGGIKIATKGSLKGGIKGGVKAGAKVVVKKASVGALSKTLAILGGPVGWAIIGTWIALDIAGPAYRVTIPSVIYIIFLKRKHSIQKYSDGYEEL